MKCTEYFIPLVPFNLKWVEPEKPALTPRELSERAIANIKANPFSHQQRAWHSKGTRPKSQFIHPCGTAHCYAGHIDLILGIPKGYTDIKLYNDVRSALGLSCEEFYKITYSHNTIARIEALHRVFFVDGIYGENELELELELDQDPYLLSDQWDLNEL